MLEAFNINCYSRGLMFNGQIDKIPPVMCNYTIQKYRTVSVYGLFYLFTIGTVGLGGREERSAPNLAVPISVQTAQCTPCDQFGL